MNPKPILFSTPMVQAILDEKKSQTRRVVKLKDIPYNTVLPLNAGGYMFTTMVGDGAIKLQELYNSKNEKGIECPYSVGQVLWVRETWNTNWNNTGYIYKADEPNPAKGKGFWKPSIFMPKTAARIFLNVTEVRVERLQAISEADAKAEGIIPMKIYPGVEISFKQRFTGLWDKINDKKAPWNSNPWVWVITFERIEKPENF